MGEARHAVVLVILGLLGGALHCSGSGGACTLIGCVSEVTTTTTVPVSLDETEGATVTICRNEECATGTLHLIGSEGLVARCEFEDAERHSCDAEAISSTQVRLNLAFTFGEDDTPTNGDSYVFTFHPAGDPGTDLTQVTGTVDEYVESSPNGEGCEPTCSTAQLP
jgi:hypothetical protein